jgi:hypothetical protein
MSNKVEATFHPGSIGPVASRVLDGDSWHVALDLEPIMVSLLPDMARALHQAHLTGTLRYLADLRPGDPEYARAIALLTDALRTRGVTVVQLHPAAAERLSGELWDAKDEPLTCACGDYTENADSVCDPCREPGSYARRRSL